MRRGKTPALGCVAKREQSEREEAEKSIQNRISKHAVCHVRYLRELIRKLSCEEAVGKPFAFLRAA